MSNKTQLQTNNTALDGYIARINAAKDVAARLPEAGGSGGGSVETCTLTVNGDTPTDGIEKLWYIDGSSEIKSALLPSFGNSVTINVMKNSIFVADGLSLYIETPEHISTIDTIYKAPIKVYFITDSATVYVR